ncbi:hypothetical protein GGI35DRAFT_255394 [Trichoderma velutinum]
MKKKKVGRGARPIADYGGLRVAEWGRGTKKMQNSIFPSRVPVTAVVLVRDSRWFESRRLKVFFEIAKRRVQRYWRCKRAQHNRLHGFCRAESQPRALCRVKRQNALSPRQNFDSLLSELWSVRPLKHRLNPHIISFAMTPISRPLSPACVTGAAVLADLGILLAVAVYEYLNSRDMLRNILPLPQRCQKDEVTQWRLIRGLRSPVAVLVPDIPRPHVIRILHIPPPLTFPRSLSSEACLEAKKDLNVEEQQCRVAEYLSRK